LFLVLEAIVVLSPDQDETIHPWDVANKVYHLTDFGIDPLDYNLVIQDFKNIQRNDLSTHINNGGRATDNDFVGDAPKALQQCMISPDTTRKIGQTFMGQKATIIECSLMAIALLRIYRFCPRILDER